MQATPCPNDHGPGGCKCPDGYGLAEYARDHGHPDRSLPATKPVRLHVVTGGATLEPPCHGTMTCPCPRCARARLTPRQRGELADATPWTPRPARQRAA